MRRSAALVALVALAATAGGGLAQGDGSRDEPLARDVASSAKVSALGAPHSSGWSNGEYWEGGGDEPRDTPDPNASSSDVYDAVVALSAVPYRQCLVVVKNGALVHESYDERRGVDRSTLLNTDSVGIIATVSLVGAATQRGLFRLDQPIASYGVPNMQERFGAYAQLVTARHLLVQTHGGGEVPPGEVFRRDDDEEFLATLFELIEKTSGTSVREFARVALVEPLGLSSRSIFGEEEDEQPDEHPDDGNSGVANERFSVSASDVGRLDSRKAGSSSRPTSPSTLALAYGKHLKLTCRDLATLAQLFLNGGVWRENTPPRKNRQIVSAQFAREAFSPKAHFPRLNKAFGLGAWTHDPDTVLSDAFRDTSAPRVDTGLDTKRDSETRCCAPVTGMRACGESAGPLLGPLLGDPNNGGPATKVGVFLGDEGSAVFVLPDTNTAVVSLGRTVAGSVACPVGLERATAGAGAGGSLGGATGTARGGAVAKPRRDDYALLKVLWSAVRPATRSLGDGYGSGASALAGYAGGAYAEETHTKLPSETEPSSRSAEARKGSRKTASSSVADKTESSSKKSSVRDLVTSAFVDSFAQRVGDTGTLGVMSADIETDAAYVPGVGSFGASSGASKVDAEVRRLTAARSRWYADTEIRLTAEDRARQKDYDKKIEALKKTQDKYKTAYEQAKLEILAAAEEEKKAEKRERDADAAANAARWQTKYVLEQQKAQQKQLDKREREVKLAQAEYAEALAEARAASDKARGAEAGGTSSFDARIEEDSLRVNVNDFATETFAEEESTTPAKTTVAKLPPSSLDDVDPDTTSDASQFFGTERASETPSEMRKSFSRSNPSKGSRRRPSRSRVSKGSSVEKKQEPSFDSLSESKTEEEEDTGDSTDVPLADVPLDVNDLDFKASGLLDDVSTDGEILDDASTSGDEESETGRHTSLHSRRRVSRRTPSSTESTRSTPSKTRMTPLSQEKIGAPISSGDMRLALPASEATANSADDFLSSLSPSSKARVSARLGALRSLDEALEKALVDDDFNGEIADKKKSAVAKLGAFRAEEVGVVAGYIPERESGEAPVDLEKRGSESTKTGFSKRPEASLGTSLWDAVQTFFRRPVSSDAPVTVGSCLCSCPGAGAGGGGGVDACYDVDLSVSADADGPEACARLAQGANSDVCGATGVVQRCEAPGASERGAEATELDAPSSSSESSSSSSSTSKKKRSSKHTHAHASKKSSKKVAKLGSLSDALRLSEEQSARPLSFGVLGSTQTVGAYECVKTAQCPADETENGESSTFSFLVEAYECDAVSFAQCRWAPATRCPAQSRAGLGGLSASKSPYDVSDVKGFRFTPHPAAARATDETPAWRELFMRAESFAFGTAAVAFVAAAIATLKARSTGSRAHDAYALERLDEESGALSFAETDARLTRHPPRDEKTGDSPSQGGETEQKPRRGFGTDPRALALGVWEALGGREDDKTSSEREPLLAKTKTKTKSTTEPRARRKVVFDVDDPADVEGGAARFAEPEEEAESRAVAAAERAAKAARAARLERAKAAREDAERRAARAKSVEKRPVGDLTREELLERARGELPRRANAAGDTGIPGSR